MNNAVETIKNKPDSQLSSAAEKLQLLIKQFITPKREPKTNPMIDEYTAI
jgi:hypothetical protein